MPRVVALAISLYHLCMLQQFRYYKLVIGSNMQTILWRKNAGNAKNAGKMFWQMLDNQQKNIKNCLRAYYYP